MKSDAQARLYVRPMRVFVGHKTKAEQGFRKRISMPKPAALAPGVPTTPEHDLTFNGGKTIADLVFTNFYVGGSTAWQTSDMDSIDRALAAAMSDRNLNNVMVQYYPSGQITSTFRGSQILAGPPPQTVSQGDVESLVRTLFQSGVLDGFDTTSSVFNFMLPSGTILNTNEAPTSSAISTRVESTRAKMPAPQPVQAAVPHEEEENSTQGLGGYHGSIHVGSAPSEQTVYYAVGVFSEQLPDGTINGIPVFDQPWKNVVATFYHELNEARTDPDVEDAIRAGDDPSAASFLGWTSSEGEECGDFPVFEANPLSEVFQEVKLTDGSGSVPVQFQYSDADHGPGLPRATPAPFAGQPQPAMKRKVG
jgi:hypothetical protein